MLVRNTLLLKQWKRFINTKNFPEMARNSLKFMPANVSLNRQSGLMHKMVRQTEKKSKTKYYAAAPNAEPKFLLEMKHATSRTTGKPASRRIAVLNKLFMTSITDLLATGAISQYILGRGLQITEVKVTPDLNFINVYWLGPANMEADKELEVELKRCAGLLRHEISQLKVIGSAPHIQFVRDKVCTSLLQIEAVLNKIDLNEIANAEEAHMAGESMQREQELLEKYNRKRSNETSQAVPAEIAMQEQASSLPDMPDMSDMPDMPDMRQDVFGLNRERIADAMLTKLRKSKYAWEQHQRISSGATHVAKDTVSSMLPNERSQAANVVYSDYLAEHSDRRNTAERKKYSRDDHIIPLRDL